MLGLNISDVKTAYYPVYFLAIKNKNNTVSYAAVNGQTGKVAVEMPIDFKKYIIFTLILAIPIMDTLFAIIRRKLKGQSIDHADKEHLHHQLLNL